MLVQSVKSQKVGDYVGMKVDPDNIHIMIAEDHTNYFAADINAEHRLEYNNKVLDTSVTKIIPGSKRDASGNIIDASGDVIDTAKTKIMIAIQPQDIQMTDHVDEGLVDGYISNLIQPQDIQMTDHVDEGLVDGYISNLIYKGDHYSYVIHTDIEQDFIVDDEYLWNMGDHVGLVMPIEKMSFSLKK